MCILMNETIQILQQESKKTDAMLKKNPQNPDISLSRHMNFYHDVNKLAHKVVSLRQKKTLGQ